MRNFIPFLMLGWLWLALPCMAGPLHDAARAGQLNKVRQLISKGAQVNAVDAYGFSPLLLAQLNDHSQTARLLTRKGARDQLQPLVKQLQFYLSELGHDTGGIDGFLGPSTRDAIRAFQRQEKRPVTGRVDEQWVHRLHNKMLSKVQRDLKTLGFYGGDIDGLIGPATRDAMRAFQQQAGLPITASIEPAWLSAVQNALQRSSGASTQKNSSGNSIGPLQTALTALGYDTQGVDGQLGSATQSAIRAFEREQGLPITGKPSARLNQRVEQALLRQTQTQLSALGYKPGPADGQLGDTTRKAIRAFQQDQKLALTGQTSAGLLTVLQNTLSKQQQQAAKKAQIQHTQVEQAQRQLQILGYKIGRIDGQAGPATAGAVKTFQQRQGLSVDGAITDRLLAALDQALKQKAAAQDKPPLPQNQPVVAKEDNSSPQKEKSAAAKDKSPAQQNAPATTPAATKNKPSPQKVEASADVIVKSAAPNKRLIAEVQSRLNSLGYRVGSPDGKIGPRTQDGIRAFQAQIGITVDGKASQSLLAAIKNTPLEKARAPKSSKQASKGKNTEVRGRLVLQRASNGTLVGCSIKGVQLDLSWCQPFIVRKNTRNCKAIIRPNSKVLLVKCG